MRDFAGSIGIKFTFHTGQMETLSKDSPVPRAISVHIPHRSDGDSIKFIGETESESVHIPHRSDGDRK